MGSEFVDLKRMVPVPSGEPIPIVDFVRPETLAYVQLNYAGTHIGAISPGENDHTNLVTFELASGKIDGVGAPNGDMDIFYFRWLEANRLAYLVSKKR